jgi:anti-sigma regulatory factor (Ser/Thr protein kinase)
VVILTVPPEPASVGRARRFVTEALLAEGIDPAACSSAELLTSELVTNGIVHGRTEVQVRLDLTQQAVRVEVTDGGGGSPLAAQVPPEAERGRGLMIVSRLARRWGVASESGRTAVWFEVRPSGAMWRESA